MGNLSGYGGWEGSLGLLQRGGAWCPLALKGGRLWRRGIAWRLSLEPDYLGLSPDSASYVHRQVNKSL